MNQELINELKNDAIDWVMDNCKPDELNDYEWEKAIDRKFAELIVRECANQCDLLLDHKISSEWSRGTHDCSRAIMKHFGVEK
jgi:hypothetical protein